MILSMTQRKILNGFDAKIVAKTNDQQTDNF